MKLKYECEIGYVIFFKSQFKIAPKSLKLILFVFNYQHNTTMYKLRCKHL